MNNPSGFNTLYYDLKCPNCGSAVESGIGFRAGVLRQASYKIGDKLSWDGPNSRPVERPAGGNFKTIGYFNCDNLKCTTWHDCFPEVQEALITIRDDVIAEVVPVTHKPGAQSFDILPP